MIRLEQVTFGVHIQSIAIPFRVPPPTQYDMKQIGWNLPYQGSSHTKAPPMPLLLPHQGSAHTIAPPTAGLLPHQGPPHTGTTASLAGQKQKTQPCTDMSGSSEVYPWRFGTVDSIFHE